MVSFINRLARSTKGQGLVEYGILVAGVALVGVIAVSFLGHKAGDMIGTVAAVMPGSQLQDNAAVNVGYLIETDTSTSQIALDSSAIQANDSMNVDRLGNNAGFQTAYSAQAASLVVTPVGDGEAAGF